MTAKSLEWLDRLVRVAVRKWLHLPHDTPTGYFHAKASSGGLEVPRLRYTIPPLKSHRMGRVEESEDPVMQSVATSPLFLGARRRCTKTARVAGRELSDRKDANILLATQLHSSVDGRRLKQQGQTPHV